MTKSEKREKVKRNQSKMNVQGMYLRKVILPLLRKKAEIAMSSNGRTKDFESFNSGSIPFMAALLRTNTGGYPHRLTN